MAITGASFIQQSDSTAPGAAGCNLQGGNCVEKYLVSIESQTDITDAINFLIGSTSTDVGDGRLSRTPPIAHPVFPYWTVTAIQNIVGAGVPTLEDADDDLEVPTLPQYLLYPQYFFTVQYGPKPYAILQDSSITLQTGQTWYDGNGGAFPASYAQEWQRYTDWDVMSKDEYITAQQGQMVFRTGDAAAPGGAPPYAFAGMPKIYMPNQIIKFKWFQVPYRYISSPNSWITSELAVGKINQNDWYNWDAGQLLYLGYNPIRYTPPVQELNQWTLTTYSTEKLCDIELVFLKTTRVAVNTPSPSDLANPNWIPAFHNAQPWFTDRQFYYVSVSGNNTTPSEWIPYWFSFPFELLFTDPDVA